MMMWLLLSYSRFLSKEYIILGIPTTPRKKIADILEKSNEFFTVREFKKRSICSHPFRNRVNADKGESLFSTFLYQFFLKFENFFVQIINTIVDSFFFLRCIILFDIMIA